MAMGLTTTSTTVTVSGSVQTGFPKAGTGQTIKVLANGKAGTNVTAGTGITAGAVTAGKIFYVSSIAISTNTDGEGIEIRDNAIGGILKAAFKLYAGAATSTISATFPTPLSFATDVFIDVSITGYVFYTISGWEE